MLRRMRSAVHDDRRRCVVALPADKRNDACCAGHACIVGRSPNERNEVVLVRQSERTKLVSPALPHRKAHRCPRPQSRVHSFPPPHHFLRVGLVRCRCRAWRRCRTRPLPMSPPPHKVLAGRALPPLQRPLPPSRPSAACTSSYGRPPPCSSALAGAPVGVGLRRFREDRSKAFRV